MFTPDVRRQIMKSIFGTWCATALSLIVGSSAAIAISSPSFAQSVDRTPPITLVNLARQGYLQNQGIPSGSSLVQAIATGTIPPEALIQAGIQNNLVPSSALNDPGYLNIVQVEFQDILQRNLLSSGS
jgi:hypothetical protein